jgi:hypothetical protein
MIKYSEFKELQAQEQITNEMEDKIALLMYLSENDEMINESYDFENLTEAQEELMVEGINDWLGKVGMKLHKGDGIIDYLKGFAKGTGEIIMAAIKKDEAKVKEIAGRMDKAKVVDFLLKLDMATMHIVTGPIHFIDAVTGWDLMANLKHAAEGAKDMLKTFYDAIAKVKASITSVLGGDRQKKMMRVATNLEYNMPDPK